MTATLSSPFVGAYDFICLSTAAGFHNYRLLPEAPAIGLGTLREVSGFQGSS